MSTIVVARRPSPVEDYGLSAIAEHNAQGIERFPPYEDQEKGLGIFHDGYAATYQGSYVQNPPTPSSSDGVRTRSGRTTRRTDSPFSTSKSRVSKSPSSKPKKGKKSKLDKSKTPQLTAPLSVLTKDMTVATKNMDEWVNRSAEVRQQEVEKRNGYVTRPMNSFMLYRSCYAERTKQWCTQNNHQVVSSVSGESWPMEPPEVRERFNEWAKQERANHAAAHPDYKFSPSKSTNKRRKDDDSDVEDASELGDPDAEYRGGRNVRTRRAHTQEPVYVPSSHGFETTPYYQQPSGYEQSQFQYANPGRPLPSNVAYDQHGLPYNPQTNTYIQTAVPHPQYQYAVQEPVPPRAPSPSLGSYGLPGGQAQSMYASSRTSTPMQQYNQYGQSVYQQYAPQPYHQPGQFGSPVPQMYSEHQRYLQSQLQPQEVIDPSLAAMLNEHGQVLPVDAHFESAMGDLSGDFQLEYYDQQTSPDATLAPQWSPTDALK
ncbi:hypothetical protein LTR95_000815 [Oleoguttula sp. CCFEE 5521]